MYISPTSKYQFSERHRKQYHTYMVLEGKLAVKLHFMDVKVVTSSDRNLGHDQVTMGRVHNPGSNNDESLSFVSIQYHAKVIAPLLNPGQVLVMGGSNSRSVG